MGKKKVIERKKEIRHRPGFVYICTNNAAPNRFKIGYTTNPERRIKTLNSHTGGIGEWKLNWKAFVGDGKLAERILHYTFRACFVEKENFSLDFHTITEVKSISSKVIKTVFDVDALS
jgi:hypothetical protein